MHCLTLPHMFEEDHPSLLHTCEEDYSPLSHGPNEEYFVLKQEHRGKYFYILVRLVLLGNSSERNILDIATQRYQ